MPAPVSAAPPLTLSPAFTAWGGAFLLLMGMLGALYATVRWPCWFLFRHLVRTALGCELPWLWEQIDAHYKPHIDDRSQKIGQALAGVQALQTALDAQGRQLAPLADLAPAVTRLATVVAEMGKAVEKLDVSLENAMTDTAYIKGRIEAWDGEDRRVSERRQPARR